MAWPLHDIDITNTLNGYVMVMNTRLYKCLGFVGLHVYLSVGAETSTVEFSNEQPWSDLSVDYYKYTSICGQATRKSKWHCML
jgi:hypothetical protein